VLCVPRKYSGEIECPHDGFEQYVYDTLTVYYSFKCAIYDSVTV